MEAAHMKQPTPMKLTTLRLPPKLWTRVRLLAIHKGVSAQQLVIGALEKMLKEEKAMKGGE
jgi:predicted HicB family RNase H-like nuclease